MDIKTIVQALRDKGSVTLKEGQGNVLKFMAPENWDDQHYHGEAIFLLFDLFQIRSIALPYSEVSLDIVEFASKPVVYHTPISKDLQNAPAVDGLVKFVLIREGIWNRLLFNFGKPLIYQPGETNSSIDFETSERFPLLASGVKQMFLGPEGEVKIING